MIFSTLSYFLLTASIQGCPDTKMVNPSKLTWNQEDYKVLDRAEIRCSQLYSKSPCVKIFIKRTKMDYSVVCGQKDNVE